MYLKYLDYGVNAIAVNDKKTGNLPLEEIPKRED